MHVSKVSQKKSKL